MSQPPQSLEGPTATMSLGKARNVRKHDMLPTPAVKRCMHDCKSQGHDCSDVDHWLAHSFLMQQKHSHNSILQLSL